MGGRKKRRLALLATQQKKRWIQLLPKKQFTDPLG